MRIASKLERESKNKEPKSKCYIVPEGEKTEIQYFCGVRDNAEELNVRPIIDIIPMINDEDEAGQSHPKEKIENFNKGLKEGKYTFENEIDRVCFVVDRDPQNFSESQLNDFIEECNKQGYEVYLSNPTFEIFLLMHDDRILGLDRKTLFENRRISRNRRYLEVQLSEFFGCCKTNLNFEKFKFNIKNAIKNEKIFCEDLEGLKTNLGSNVAKLLNSIIDKD